MHKRIEVQKGDSFDLILPSGRVINVEVTADTADVTIKAWVLFAEERDGKKWEPTWPNALLDDLPILEEK